jgi:hypothetical protein
MGLNFTKKSVNKKIIGIVLLLMIECAAHSREVPSLWKYIKQI